MTDYTDVPARVPRAKKDGFSHKAEGQVHFMTQGVLSCCHGSLKGHS